jgi:hypothetical protein
MVGTAILIGILSYLPSDLKFTRKMIREAKAELGNYDKQVQKEEAKLKALKTSTAYIAAKERENHLREADAQLAEQWHRAWWESCKA